ncbi:MAG: hypothetical protein NTX56_19705 [Proteobacteria bacterium]|nr:hypothetical protein [Pseudomonadota bacterium]
MQCRPLSAKRKDAVDALGEFSVMKDLLYICVKNPFSERDMERMGIEALEKHFDVQILDCTAWLMPKAFATRGRSTVMRNNLRCIHSLSEFRAELADRQGGFAADYVGPFSIQAVLLFDELKRKKFKLVVVDSGAYPSPESTLGKLTSIEKLIGALRHGGLRQHINARMIRLLLKMLPDQTPDYALVAGSSWRTDPRFSSARVKIPAHSFDYETYLIARKEKPFRDDDYAVYLDEDIAGHEDNAELGFREPATSASFYPALTNFLDEFERTHDVPVLIAGYPSSDRSMRALRFGRREVVYGQTAALIRNAKLIFAHASTAISYAVLWRRPIVFLTSTEILGSWYQPWIEASRRLLHASIAPVDRELPEMEGQDSWFDVDRDAYEHYENCYIKASSAPETSIWETMSSLRKVENEGMDTQHLSFRERLK